MPCLNKKNLYNRLNLPTNIEFYDEFAGTTENDKIVIELNLATLKKLKNIRLKIISYLYSANGTKLRMKILGTDRACPVSTNKISTTI